MADFLEAILGVILDWFINTDIKKKKRKDKKK